MNYRVVAEHPHDVRHYTQGLVFVGDSLAESTGRYGRSQVIRYAPDLTPIERVDLPVQRFGEGLAWFQQRLWQLTWLSGELRVFQHNPLHLERQLSYSGEGWGLTSDDHALYLSNGSAYISVRDAQFQELRRFLVRDGQRPISQLNELEWVDDQLYANIWHSDRIARIDPHSGCVTGWLDLTSLWPKAQRDAHADVLNGMAWHPLSQRLWVTGKLWPRFYVLQIDTPTAATP